MQKRQSSILVFYVTYYLTNIHLFSFIFLVCTLEIQDSFRVSIILWLRFSDFVAICIWSSLRLGNKCVFPLFVCISMHKYSVLCMYKFMYFPLFSTHVWFPDIFSGKEIFLCSFLWLWKFFFIGKQSAVFLLKTLCVTVATEAYSNHLLPDEYSKNFIAFSFVVSNSTYALSIVFSKYCFHPPSFTCISQVCRDFHLVVLAFHSLILFTLSIFIPAHSSSSSINLQVKFSWTQIISFLTLYQ